MHIRAFEYMIYAMEYEDAMSHLEQLKSLPRKNIRMWAHIYNTTSEKLEEVINTVSQQSPEDFAESVRKLCEARFDLVNSREDRELINMAIYMYLSVHAEDGILNYEQDDGRKFIIYVEDTKIRASMNTLDYYCRIRIENLRVVAQFGDYTHEFTVSDEVLIYAKDSFMLSHFVGRIFKYIFYELKCHPFLYVKQPIGDSIDVVRMFNILWPESHMFDDWRVAFENNMNQSIGRKLTEEEFDHVGIFTKHPKLQTYEDVGGMVCYIKAEKSNRALLVLERENGEYVLGNKRSQVYKRFKLLGSMSDIL